MTTIDRLGPPKAYLSSTIFDHLGIAQSVRAGDSVHISGVIGLRTNGDQIECVAPSDMAAQLSYVLDNIEACLVQHGLALEHLVSLHVFVTNNQAFAEGCEQFNKRLSAVRPASTVVEVSALGHPEALVEISAVAHGPVN